MNEKRGLGKGLGALLSGGDSPHTDANVREARIDQIKVNPYQPRKSFEPESLGELAASIKENGILQPLLVRAMGMNHYELIAGERRLRAAKLNGMSSVPVVVRDINEQQMLEFAIIENVQREDINAVDAAVAYSRLIDEFGLTQKEIALRIGKSQPTIANKLRLLALPSSIQESLRSGAISEGHARTLLQVPAQHQLAAWKRIVADQLSVRDSEKLSREFSGAVMPDSPAPRDAELSSAIDPNLRAIEEALGTALGTRVRVTFRGDLGKIVIEYYSEDQLEGLIERIIG